VTVEEELGEAAGGGEVVFWFAERGFLVALGDLDEAGDGEQGVVGGVEVVGLGAGEVEFAGGVAVDAIVVEHGLDVADENSCRCRLAGRGAE